MRWDVLELDFQTRSTRIDHNRPQRVTPGEIDASYPTKVSGKPSGVRVAGKAFQEGVAQFRRRPEEDDPAGSDAQEVPVYLHFNRPTG
jgi:hypothetical protein